jgi:hypothetical protein
VSRHRSETTYHEVINAPGSRKRKAANVQHPEAPRVHVPRPHASKNRSSSNPGCFRRRSTGSCPTKARRCPPE